MVTDTSVYINILNYLTQQNVNDVQLLQYSTPENFSSMALIVLYTTSQHGTLCVTYKYNMLWGNV